MSDDHTSGTLDGGVVDVIGDDPQAASASDETAASPTPHVTDDGRFAHYGRRGKIGLAVIVTLAVIAGASVYKAVEYRDEFSTLSSANADAQRSQDIASDYAVKAAMIDYKNFDPWFAGLESGVDDTMAKQFADSEPALRDLLGQLQWVSKGTLVGSDIKSLNDGKYEVQVFVDVEVTNVQSPAGVKTTALYPITVDKNADYAITDISGGVAPLPTK